MTIFALSLLIIGCNTNSATEQDTSAKMPKGNSTYSDDQINIQGFTYTKPFRFIKDEHYLDGGTTCVELKDANNKLLPFCLEPPPRGNEPQKMYLGRISHSENRIFVQTRADEELLANILRDSIKDFEMDTSSPRKFEGSIFKPGTFTNSIHEYILKRSRNGN